MKLLSFELICTLLHGSVHPGTIKDSAVKTELCLKTDYNFKRLQCGMLKQYRPVCLTIAYDQTGNAISRVPHNSRDDSGMRATNIFLPASALVINDFSVSTIGLPLATAGDGR